MFTIRFDIEPNTKVRFLFQSLDLSKPYRSMIWLKITSDGSLLTGPSNQGITEVRLGRPAPIGTNSARVTYGEGVKVRGVENEENFYLSFHSSGAINLHIPKQPLHKGRTLRNLDKPTLLCVWVFQSPDVYPAVTLDEMNARNAKRRNHDLPIGLPPFLDHPLQAQIYVGPVDQAFPVQMESCSLQSRYILRCSDLKGMHDSFVQVVFGLADSPAPMPPCAST
jgi:hypothetical protein